MSYPVLSTHQMTPGERNNVIYLVLQWTVAFPMRAADLAVIESMRDSSLVGSASVENLVRIACQYAWDHLAGEPEEFDAFKLYDHVEPSLQAWYDATTQEQRDDTT